MLDKDIKELPTILDVVEQISAHENSLVAPMCGMVPIPPFYDEGRFNLVSDMGNRSIHYLMPTSQSPFTFYRGQNKYYDICTPTLYRPRKNKALPSEEDIAYHRIKTCEFAMLLSTHPVFQDIQRVTAVDPVALAQHYGLDTDYLDITNNKWVAAFFACTQHDDVTDTYTPVGEEFADGYGVMYKSKKAISDDIPDGFFKKNCVIGYQYFDRPSRQSSFGYLMEAGENFNDSPFFDKLFFRHDAEASQIVFEMAYQQRRFIPNDPLSKLAKDIVKSKEISKEVLENCILNFYPDSDIAFLERVCKNKGLHIHNEHRLSAQFNAKEVEKEWETWLRWGRKDLELRILPQRLVTTMRLKEE